MPDMNKQSQTNGKDRTNPSARRWIDIVVRFLITILLLMLLLTLNRCSQPGGWLSRPRSGDTPVPPSNQPDLTVTHASIELETGGACDYESTDLGVRVWLKNAGQGDAGGFTVEVNGLRQDVPAGLPAGERLSLWFSGYIHSAENMIVIDTDGVVNESDETNNSFNQRLPIPTLPPPCTPSSALPVVTVV